MSKTIDKYSAAELQKKYSGNSGYKQSTNKTCSNSSFWLDDNFIREKQQVKELDQKVSKAAEYVQLASYQRAISNFVRIVTGRTDIPVLYSSGADSYTDGKKVVISAKLEEKEFDSTVGLALHEASHIALSDFELLNRLAWDYDRNVLTEKCMEWHKQRKNNFLYFKLKDLINIIEDRRIDRSIYDSAPGYQGYYQSLYNRYFNAKEIDQALAAGLKDDPTSWNDYMFHICNFTNPNRNLQTLPALQKCWDIIHIPTINRLKSTEDVVAVAADVYITIAQAIEDAQNEADTKPRVATKQTSSASGQYETETGDEQLNENLDTPDSTMESSQEVGTGTGQDADNSQSQDEDNSQEQDVDPSEQAKQELLSRIGKKLEQAIENQKDFLKGNVNKKSLSKKDAAAVNAAVQSNAAIATVGGQIQLEDGSTYDIGSVNCLVIRGLSKSLLESDILSHITEPPATVQQRITRGYGKDYIAEGITLGTLLGKRLKTRDEERTLKTTRLSSGRIDKRLLAELGFGSERVFANTQYSTTRLSHMHISVDASGSMDGAPWESAMKTAIAIAKAASMTSSIEVVISVRGTVQSDAVMWIVYDSRKDTIASIRESIYAVQPRSSTPEGLCFEAVLQELLSYDRNKEKYFCNISDGEPAFGHRKGSYHGEPALQHTRKQIEAMRAAGIQCMSYFVSDSQDYTSRVNFRKMYGQDSKFIDVNSLSQLAATLTELFERKNS